ncbi:MAG: hypothetical protein DRI84_05575 [Bacteroidetes bacterium]|nr:MAG: hypothetical protein DRI84_05575 [Bacteroidota bacterium]
MKKFLSILLSIITLVTMIHVFKAIKATDLTNHPFIESVFKSQNKTTQEGFMGSLTDEYDVVTNIRGKAADGFIRPTVCQFFGVCSYTDTVSSLPEQTYTQFSDANDGYITLLDVDWTTTREAAQADEAYNGYTGDSTFTRVRNWGDAGPSFSIARSFYEFDLTGLPASDRTVKSVQLQITSSDDVVYEAGSIMVQESTAIDGASSVDNYGLFTGSGFLDTGLSWVEDTDNLMTFNATGVAYIQSKLGSVAKFCFRDYDHDFLDVPTTSTSDVIFSSFCSENTSGSFPDLKSPKLIITYEKEEVWTSIFDNTKWAEDFAGTWNGAQNRWESDASGSLYIVPTGTWNLGYRPSKIRLTWQWVGASDDMYMDLFADCNDWDSVTDPEGNYPIYTNLEEINVVGNNHHNICEIDIYAWPGNQPFYITNIEFLEP